MSPFEEECVRQINVHNALKSGEIEVGKHEHRLVIYDAFAVTSLSEEGSPETVKFRHYLLGCVHAWYRSGNPSDLGTKEVDNAIYFVTPRWNATNEKPCDPIILLVNAALSTEYAANLMPSVYPGLHDLLTVSSPRAVAMRELARKHPR